MAEPAAAAAGRIFISYRREETAYPAGWLRDRLTEEYGEGQVFKDVNSIELGEDFVDRITSAVGSCDVLLALIGNNWATVTDGEGRRRLDDADDFVRLEIQVALERDVLVIPVLVDGARMPEPEVVPPSLTKLTRRHALELSPSRFESDVERLLKVLDRTIRRVPAAGSDPPPDAPASGSVAQGRAPRRLSSWPSTGKLIGLGAAGMLLLLLIIGLLAGSEDGDSSSSGIIFEDDFSDAAAGWQAIGSGTGTYEDGVYRLSAEPMAEGGLVAAAPTNAASVYPSAPPNVRVEAHAQRLSSTGTDVGVALLCRVAGRTAYQFTMANDHVSIAKLTGQAPYFDELASDSLTVDPNSLTTMRAECIAEAGGRQHLVFLLNGDVVAEIDDTDRPLSAGSVGLGVVVGPGDHTIEAHFDDVVVTDIE